ncbi:MAG: 1-deoxy-D-xylulose-5-phosphate reductoisomerase [Limnohabitans sp.]|jgi:1-deoxy-D-xylulose-5-phosphate reductoisomerase|nr:1-deoxy-D-xylulose-5-phosphate reductoisomerase [Limnohabitans sp.]
MSTNTIIPRRLFLLGATGSIGTSALDVVRDFVRRGERRFEVAGIASLRNGTALAAIAQEFRVQAVAVAQPEATVELPQSVALYRGPNAACELLQRHARPGDLVLAAVVGAAGIEPVLTAISCGCDIALANKEALVAAGAIVMPAARAAGVRMLPVDSEHNALFQCLKASTSLREVRKVVLTASGGPFRSKTRDEMARATVEHALAHPTWQMGPKVTIDSASLMNKALELIEAHWLFGLESARLEAIVHPQSIVHGFVEYLDGSVLAQLSPPDMRTPIQQALCDPERFDGPSRKLDFHALRTLDFAPVDHDRFPAIALARRVIDAGGTAGAVFNAANEIAVEAFLERRIGFLEIAEVVRETLDAATVTPVQSLADVRAADQSARHCAREIILLRARSFGASASVSA